MPSISIRIDDIDHQTSIFGLQRLYEFLEKIDGECELSVIPFRGDISGNWLVSLISFVEDMPRFNLSLHGHTHIKRTQFSEFSGLSRECQYNLIAPGVDLMSSSSRFVEKFVPPWNSYDENTLLACTDLGIKVVGASYKQCISTNSEIKVECISADFREFLRLPRFYDKLFGSWHANLMFHTYDFTELHGSGTHSFQDFFEILTSRKVKLTKHSNINLDKLYAFNLMRDFRKQFPNKLTPSLMKIGSVCKS